MKLYIVLLSLISSSIALADPATFNLYISPTGSDANDCSSAASACQTPNAALEKVAPVVTAPVIINADVGKYYSPPFATDGGAPTIADGKALIDIEGFSILRHSSLTVLGSTQQINPAGLVIGAVDAGALGGATPYEGWVQIAIDGGLGDYANDAGYCYMDGGACVLLTNALVGTYIQFTTGAGLITAPIVSNTTGAGAIAINYVTHSSAFATQPAAPTAASKFNLFALASHFYPYPIDAGATTGYTLATVWVGGNNSDQAADDIYAANQATRIFSTSPAVVLQYLDLVDAPQSTNADLDDVNSFGPNLVSIRNSNLQGTASAVGAVEYNGVLELAGDYVNAPFGAAQSEGGRLMLTGDLLKSTSASVFPVDIAAATSSLYNDVVIATASAGCVRGRLASQLSFASTFMDQGNSTGPCISTRDNTNTRLQTITWISDGGAGLLACGADGLNTLLTVNLPDAGANEISLDDGVTYTTATGIVAIDGGSAGIHATCNGGTGCCLSSY